MLLPLEHLFSDWENQDSHLDPSLLINWPQNLWKLSHGNVINGTVSLQDVLGWVKQCFPTTMTTNLIKMFEWLQKHQVVFWASLDPAAHNMRQQSNIIVTHQIGNNTVFTLHICNEYTSMDLCLQQISYKNGKRKIPLNTSRLSMPFSKDAF